MPEIVIETSWRKSISMKLDSAGVLRVKAPVFVTRAQVQRFIGKHESWITRQYEDYQERLRSQGYYYLGERYESPLEFPGYTAQSDDALSVRDYYRAQAREYISPRCEALACKHGFEYKALRITSAKTRWGSCSSKGSLNFSYRLMMAPPEAIEYVIIHELCHLREMNHSPRFWAQVASILPNYKVQEKVLKDISRKSRY